MKPRFVVLLAALVTFGSPAAFGQAYVTNAAGEVFMKIQLHPVAMSFTNTIGVPPAQPGPRVKGIRQFKKECPECSATVVSTNLVFNTVISTPTDPAFSARREGSVMFKCTCGEVFSDQITMMVRRTPPMEELPPLPPNP